MKDMSIDKIIDLYRQGHLLEGTQREPDIINLQTCTVTISTDRTSAVEGDFIRLTAIVDPPTPGATVIFKAETMRSSKIINYDIGTCDGSSGTCYVDWDTINRSSEAPIHITAVVSGPYDCTSSPIDITISRQPVTIGDVLFVAAVAIPSAILALIYLKK